MVISLSLHRQLTEIAFFKPPFCKKQKIISKINTSSIGSSRKRQNLTPILAKNLKIPYKQIAVSQVAHENARTGPLLFEKSSKNKKSAPRRNGKENVYVNMFYHQFLRHMRIRKEKYATWVCARSINVIYKNSLQSKKIVLRKSLVNNIDRPCHRVKMGSKNIYERLKKRLSFLKFNENGKMSNLNFIIFSKNIYARSLQ